MQASPWMFKPMFDLLVEQGGDCCYWRRATGGGAMVVIDSWLVGLDGMVGLELGEGASANRVDGAPHTHKGWSTRQLSSETRDHGHALGSRRSDKITDYLGENPGGILGTAQAKPLLLVDPNRTSIGHLPSSIHHPLECCIFSMDGLSVKQVY